MKLLKAVVNAGVEEDQPVFLQRKISFANQIALFIAFGVGVPFIVISNIYAEELVIIPVLGLLVCGISILLNAFGFGILGRLLICITPCYLSAMYGAGVSAVGEPPFAHTWLLTFTFALMPMLVFDIRERLGWVVGCFINLAAFIFYEDLNAFLEIENFDNGFFQEGFVVYLTIVMAFLTGYFGLYILGRQIFTLENKTATLVEEMDNKNLELQSSGEVLQNKLDELESARKEEEKRNWATTGIAEFSNLLRADLDFHNLCDEVITKLVNYTEANQGGIYIVNEEYGEKFLSLESSYAYGKKKFQEKRVEIGQGLLGQAYVEKDFIHLKEIPDNYTSITSGLGQATPNHLIIVPMIVNEKVEGIFELASFDAFETHVIRFVQELGEAMAGTLSSKKMTEQTTKLLEETRQQTEEMRAQEEEMRQNMEELQATQEEMHRKEREYIERIEKLETELGALK